MKYPRNIYSIREDVTIANRRAYDKMQQKKQQLIEARYPDYHSFDLRTRAKIARQIEEELASAAN